MLAAEAGATATADPLGGSYYVEALTDELEARAWELIARIDELGGAVAAIEAGWVQGEIEAAAYAWTAAVEAGERTIVGVNAFADEGEDEPIELHRLDPEARAAPGRADARACAPSATRPRPSARSRAVREAARGTENLLPPLRDALARALHGRRALRRCCARSGARTTASR